MNRLLAKLTAVAVLIAAPALHAQPLVPDGARDHGRIESVVRQGLFPMIKVGERTFLIDRSVAVQWSDGSDADRALLLQGTRVQLEFHRDGIRLRRIVIQVE